MSHIADGISALDAKITSFLMIGQSNMAGRGDFEDVRPIKRTIIALCSVWGAGNP